MLKPCHPKLLRTSQMPSSRELESVFNLAKRTFISKSSPISQSIYCLGFSNSRSLHSDNPSLFKQSDPVLQRSKVETVFDPLTNDLVTITAADDSRDSGRAHENRSQEKPVVKKPTWSGQNAVPRAGAETGIGLSRKRYGKTKEKVNWVCQECGASEGQWWGSCPSCKAAGSLKQFRVPVVGGSKIRRSWLAERVAEVVPKRLTEVNKGMNQLEWRIPLSGLFGMEVSRVLGGGLVPGSLILVGGDPGVGKSTLLLQIAAIVAEGHDFQRAPVLYVSGEESIEQIGNRADRMRIGTDEIFLYSSTDIEDILEKAQGLSPRALVIDSIQTVYLRGLEGSAGNITQVKECTSALLRFAKQTNIPVLLIGHVTKTGEIAGPRVLEHIVDTVIYMEGEKHSSYRLLRSVKNRFGSTDELGVFEMSQSGLQAVLNPSEMFLSENTSDSEVLAGLAVAVVIDGSRTFLVEVQALCSTDSGDTKHFNGVPKGRADMIITVLMKQAGLKLQNSAVFLNVVSGLDLTETGGDLAIAAAICSSFLEFPLPNDAAFIGEIGLGGELRTVPRMDKRVTAVAKLGYKKCFIPQSAEKYLSSLNMGETMIIGCKNMKEAIDKMFYTE